MTRCLVLSSGEYSRYEVLEILKVPEGRNVKKDVEGFVSFFRENKDKYKRGHMDAYLSGRECRVDYFKGLGYTIYEWDEMHVSDYGVLYGRTEEEMVTFSEYNTSN